MFNIDSRHTVIDLETYATTPDAAVFAVAAVTFTYSDLINSEYSKDNPTLLIPETTAQNYWLIDPNDVQGARDKSTTDWWGEQSDYLKELLFNGFDLKTGEKKNSVYFEAMWPELLSQITGDQADLSNVYLWGNGAAFDNAILRYQLHYRNLRRSEGSLPLEYPVHYRNDRCLRTFLDTGRGIVDVPGVYFDKSLADYVAENNLVKHHPLHDCLMEYYMLLNMFKAIDETLEGVY
jgi:hypothetical protein